MADSSEYVKFVPSRTEANANSKTQRIWSKGHDDIGLAGEFAFGEFCGLWPQTQTEELMGGDGGVDFKIALLWSVDVKTASIATNLIHEQGRPFSADIFVLAQYYEATDKKKAHAIPVGWAWGHELKKAPVRDFGGGVLSHYIPAKKLKDMAILKERQVRFG